MSHKVYVGKQGSILKAEFSPQGLENPVTYVPEAPEWDGKTLVKDVPLGKMMFVYVGPHPTAWQVCKNRHQWQDNSPAIPIIEPKPLEEE